jgi:hypothetical protein
VEAPWGGDVTETTEFARQKAAKRAEVGSPPVCVCVSVSVRALILLKNI